MSKIILTTVPRDMGEGGEEKRWGGLSYISFAYCVLNRSHHSLPSGLHRDAFRFSTETRISDVSRRGKHNENSVDRPSLLRERRDSQPCAMIHRTSHEINLAGDARSLYERADAGGARFSLRHACTKMG